MIESTTYMDSVKNHELVPQFTLNPLVNPEDEWTTREMLELFQKSNEQFNGDMEHNMVQSIEFADLLGLITLSLMKRSLRKSHLVQIS